MPPVRARCLDDVQLLALVETRLASALRDDLLAHLDACRACLELLAQLVATLEARADA